MADKVLFQTDDALSEDNLAEQRARENSTDYVERGLDIDPDWANNEIDVGSGQAAIKDGALGFDAYPDARTNRALADGSGMNYVFVTINPSNKDDISIDINSSGSAPSSASLLIAEVDASAQTVSEVARAPDATFGATEHESVSADGAVIGDNHHWASSYDGGDPTTRLSNAIDGVSEGDVIYLENEPDYGDVIIDTRCRLIGSGITFRGTGIADGATWTLQSNGIEIECMGSGSNGEIVIDARSCAIRRSGIFSVDITVNESWFKYIGNEGGAVTFDSGTDSGIVDGCTDTTVTDNGTNTIGEIA
jgi:hypothetical protein